mgnify:CR=1 FL=1
MALTLSQKSATLAAYLTANRSAATGSLGQDARETTGVQRLGIVTSIAGQTYTLYYDPSADQIFYDTGTPVLSQQ